eukprot:CCRYP_008432-RA/>CCRYP_008432-RA protein AED:0.01 eAED:0.01 QI:842/1/1/1/0.85/0.75/8/449/1945
MSLVTHNAVEVPPESPSHQAVVVPIVLDKTRSPADSPPVHTTFVDSSNDSPPPSTWLLTYVDEDGIHAVYSPVSPTNAVDDDVDEEEKEKSDKKLASPSSVMTPLSSPFHAVHGVAKSDCISSGGGGSYWNMAERAGRISAKSAEVARLRKLLMGRKLSRHDRFGGGGGGGGNRVSVHENMHGAACKEETGWSGGNDAFLSSSEDDRGSLCLSLDDGDGGGGKDRTCAAFGNVSSPADTTTTTMTATTSNDNRDPSMSTPSQRLVSSRGHILFKKRFANLHGNQRVGTIQCTENVNPHEMSNSASHVEADGNGGGDGTMVIQMNCSNDNDGSNHRQYFENDIGQAQKSVSSRDSAGDAIQSPNRLQSPKNSSTSSGNIHGINNIHRLGTSTRRGTVQEYFQRSHTTNSKPSRSILFHQMLPKKKSLSPLITASSAFSLGTRGGLSGILPQKKKYPTISELCIAILPLQTLARQYLARRAIERRRRDVVIVQSVMRTWRSRRDYTFVLSRVIKIQSLYRGNVDRCEFCTLRSMVCVAVTIQKRHRGIVVRQELARQHSAATRIESQARRYVAQRLCRSILAGIIAFQSLARMFPIHQRFRQEMIAKRALLLHRCATQIQAAHRGYIQRIVYHRLTIEHDNATVIQTQWRTFYHRKQYVRIVRRDVVVVQSIVRRWSGVRRSQMKRKERNAAVAIQSWIRGYKIESVYLQTLGGIVVSQCAIRRWMARRRVNKRRMEKREREENEAARVIQAAWRGFYARREYLKTVGDLIFCQSVCRRWAASQNYIMTMTLIIVAQSGIRRWMACRRVRQLREDECLRQEYLASVSAAIKIATCWRRFQCKIRYRKVIRDVLVCQSAVRRYIAVGQADKMRHEKLVTAATKIQAMWRCFITMDLYFQTVIDVVIVQSIARRLLSMRLYAQLKENRRSLQEAAAVKIASMWRGFVAMSEYKQSILDIIICQSVARRNMAASKATMLRQNQCIASATIIQASWRARVARDVYILTMFDLVTLQSLARRLIAQRILARLKEKKHWVEVDAATAISASWRRFACLRAYRRTIADILICQSIFRRNMAVKEAEDLIIMKHEEVCASFIQEVWRAYVARERFLRVISNMKKSKLFSKSVTNISKAWRRFATRRKYLYIVRDVTLCQTAVRRIIGMKALEVLRQDHRVTSATRIQARWRGRTAQRKFAHFLSSILVLQSIVRRWLDKKELNLIWENSNNKHAAASKIQASWLAFYWRTKYILIISDVILCQSIARRFIAYKLNQVHRSISRQLTAKSNPATNQILADFETVISANTAIHSNQVTHPEQNQFQITDDRLNAPPAIHMLSYPIAPERQSIVRKIIATKKIERLLEGHLQKHHEAATIIQAAYRRHFYRAKWLFALRVIVKFQSALRKRRAVRLVEELRFVKKRGPKDIFTFIKRRKEATTMIQTAYQDYATRNFELSYKNYLRRLHQASGNTSINELPLLHNTKDQPSNEVTFCNLTMQRSETVCENIGYHVCDISPEESPKEDPLKESVSSNSKEMDFTTLGLDGAGSLVDNKPLYVVDDDLNLESRCWERSRCGLSDEVHDMLLQSGKWFYDRLGDPGDDTAEDLLTVMEISEEVAFCCWKKATTQRSATSETEVRNREDQEYLSSAIAIQSQWRRHRASKHFCEIRCQNVFDKLKSEDNIISYSSRCGKREIGGLSQSLVSSKNASRIPPRATEFDDASGESSINRYQRAVRKLTESRRAKELMSTLQVSFTRTSHSPDRKHVTRTGHIEMIFNDEAEEDAALTDYSETESSDGEIQEELHEHEKLYLSKICSGDVPPFSRTHSEHKQGLLCYQANCSEVLPHCDEINQTKPHSSIYDSNSMLNADALPHELAQVHGKEVAALTQCIVTKSTPAIREDITKEPLEANLPVPFNKRNEISEANPNQTSHRAILVKQNQPQGDDLSCVSDLAMT